MGLAAKKELLKPFILHFLERLSTSGGFTRRLFVGFDLKFTSFIIPRKAY